MTPDTHSNVMDRTRSSTHDGSYASAGKQGSYQQPSFQQFAFVSEIIRGLRDHKNAQPAAFLELVNTQLGDQLKAISPDITPIHALRKLEALNFIEIRSREARKINEDPVWNLTPVGAIWNSLYEISQGRSNDNMGDVDGGLKAGALNDKQDQRSRQTFSGTGTSGDAGSASMTARGVTSDTLSAMPSLFEFSSFDIEASLLFLSRLSMVAQTPQGYALTRSPLEDLIQRSQAPVL